MKKKYTFKKYILVTLLIFSCANSFSNTPKELIVSKKISNILNSTTNKKVLVAGQEINVQSNGITIPDNYTILSVADNTDFGSLEISSGTIIKTFVIQNTGTGTLAITGITVPGSDFTFPTTSFPFNINAGASFNLVVTFNPTTVGLKSTTITINNDDSNEGTYDFKIQGTGIQTFYDSDGDGIYDNVDIDDDNDGIKDVTEETNCESISANKANYKFLNETFGNGGRTTINTTYSATTTYCYQDASTASVCEGSPNSTDLNDGKYTVGTSAQIASWASQYWYTGTDHTTPTAANGRMALFNASNTAGIFYTAQITGALPGIPITYSFWVLNLDRADAPGIATRKRPNIKVEFRDLNDVLLTPPITTGDIAPCAASPTTGDWKQFTANLNLPVNAFKVVFINNNTGGTGNDLALDDIQISQQLCDLDYDGVADLFDLDTDNDGIPDVVEAGLGNRSNGKGVIDRTATSISSTFPTLWVDTNGDGLDDNALATRPTPLDSDGDGIPNYIDLDSDNDTVFDVDESGAGNTNAVTGFINGDGDITGDGRGDGPESEVFRSKDINGDGVVEGYGDGILDLYDYGTKAGATTTISVADFNIAFGNSSQGIANATFPSATYLLDSDNDGIPDYLDVKSDGVNFDISKTLYAALDTDAVKDGIINGSTDVDKDGIRDAFDTNTAVVGSPRNLNQKLYLDFDGRNDYAKDPVAILDNLPKASLMAWIDLNTAFSTTGCIVGQDNFQLRVTSAQKLEVFIKTSGGNKTLTSTIVLDKKRWYHVAAVYDGANLNLYLNGTKVATPATLTGTITGNTTTLTIGRDPGSIVAAGTNYFKGKIDEVRVFNTSLTDDQVQRMIYQEMDPISTKLKGTSLTFKEIGQDLTTSTSTLTYTNMVRYYRMDAYKDDIIDDLSTTAIDLTGTKIYNHKVIKVQEAPLPFITTADGDLATVVTDATRDIQGTDINTYSTIVNVKHNVTTTVDRTDLGLIIDANKSLTVNNDSGLTNTWLLRLDGKLDLQSKSQLVQNSTSDLDIASTGYIERDQQGQTSKYNYNYWSSPVSPINTTANNTNYTILGVMKDGFNSTPRNISFISGYDGVAGNAATPVSIARYWLYKFESKADDYANWVRILETDALRVGQGFTMKGSGAASNFTFVGKPNNGTINNVLNKAGTDELFLTGNPYPSALDSNKFISDNLILSTTDDLGIEGTLYFWEHYTTNTTHVVKDYQGGYAVRNLLAGIAPVSPTSISGLGLSTRIPQKYIPVGQGFFVYGKTTGGGTIVFNNSQRAFFKETDASNSNAMFKSTSTTKILPITIPENTNQIIRLGYNSNDGYHRQVVLGFVPEKATSQIDYGYDSYCLDEFPNDMYLLNGEEQLVIEGEGAFDSALSYPIGVKADADGMVSFRIDALENFDVNQPIFIYDDADQSYHDIRTETYQTTLVTGQDDTRFALRFTDKSLGVIDTTNKDIRIYFEQKNASLNISNSLTDLVVEKVVLFNILGQSINNWKVADQDQQNIKIPIKGIPAGVYIAKIKTSKGLMSKKIIVK
ncbi:LamG-like jellyroll fold domain-containing protein [Flavobacterium restrictum]|uniref:Choice-of-anchor D domain-containing protein n=1 Tax=Flavobacterium restrictum TaxID=2594428 RepID=A0A553E3T7_9FLAO|nr:LamG-like jellyroll fold domain-containing protein [Flavobacterium restrictum]TRX39681.1 choice-of-anchor D domain-containing protein [Flavobacterium restrictum]